MLRRAICAYLKTHSNQLRHCSAQAAIKEKWDLHAAVLVERLPVVTKPLNEIEKKFQDLLWQIEYENSLKSDFELQHERELALAEKIKRGEVEIDLDDSIVKQTAQDRKDAYVEELKNFKFAPRITEADKKNDLESTNRVLDDTLYLLVEQKLRDSKHLILPQGIRQEGETMRQTAERVLVEKCGDKIQVLFYGNAPCGFHKYKFPAAMRKESVGVKIFFFRASFKGGNVDKSLAKKFEWLNEDGLEKRLQNKYLKSVKQFLV